MEMFSHLSLDDKKEVIKDLQNMIKSGELKKEKWQVRKRIIGLIVENEYYDYYGVYDPMHDLMEALLFNDEEEMWCAECMESSSKYMQAEAAKIYKKFGRDDKYYSYLESTLSKDSKPYLFSYVPVGKYTIDVIKPEVKLETALASYAFPTELRLLGRIDQDRRFLYTDKGMKNVKE